jgi:hypothetical protein
MWVSVVSHALEFVRSYRLTLACVAIVVAIAVVLAGR